MSEAPQQQQIDLVAILAAHTETISLYEKLRDLVKEGKADEAKSLISEVIAKDAALPVEQRNRAVVAVLSTVQVAISKSDDVATVLDFVIASSRNDLVKLVENVAGQLKQQQAQQEAAAEVAAEAQPQA